MTASVLLLIAALSLGIVLGAFMLWFVRLRSTRATHKPVLPVETLSSTPSQPVLVRPEVINTLWDPSLGIALQEVKGLDVSCMKSASKNRTVLDRVALGQIVQAVPFIKATIEGGRIARVIGPDHLLKGLDQGILQRLGNTGAVADSSGTIVDQLRFGDFKNVRSFAGPIAAWQIASLVTCQYYLNRITAQLSSIEKGIAGLREFLANKQYAELRSSRKMLSRIAELPLLTLSEIDKQELASSRGQIDTVYEHTLKNLTNHIQEMNAHLSKDRHIIDRGEFRNFLESLKSDFRTDAGLLCLAIQGKLECLRLRLLVETAGNAESAAIRVAQVRREIVDVRKEYQCVVDGLSSFINTRMEITTWESVMKKPLPALDFSVPILGIGKYIARKRGVGKALADELDECKEELRPLYEGLQRFLPPHQIETNIVEIGRDSVSGELIGTIRADDTER